MRASNDFVIVVNVEPLHVARCTVKLKGYSCTARQATAIAEAAAAAALIELSLFGQTILKTLSICLFTPLPFSLSHYPSFPLSLPFLATHTTLALGQPH